MVPMINQKSREHDCSMDGRGNFFTYTCLILIYHFHCTHPAFVQSYTTLISLEKNNTDIGRRVEYPHFGSGDIHPRQDVVEGISK